MTKQKINVVQIDTETAAQIAQFQLKQIAKGKEKPRIKDIVKDALKKFLENEK